MDSHLHTHISDFGLSKTKEHTAVTSNQTDVMGSVPWAAPENLTYKRRAERGEKGDVYSFGVIVWELVTCEIPWKSTGMSSSDIKEAVTDGMRLEIPSSCSDLLREVMVRCWKDSKIKSVIFEVLMIF
jgi:sterile alpha motif and leucine zipper-containing kinase AZK